MNRKLFAFLFASVLLIASSVPAYALMTGVQSNDSDEVWTEVKIGSGYTTLVSSGHVIVASWSGVTSTDNDGYLGTLAASSTDQHILGVAQRSIASGDRDLVLQRGRGVLRTVANVTSRDRLAITEGATLSSRAGFAVVDPNTTTSRTNIVVATALESNTTSDSETEAYIHIL